MDSAKGGWNRFTMNLAQALNDLLEAGEFIEFRHGTPRDTAADATGEMLSSWLSASNSSSKSLKKSPKHLRGIAEGDEADAEAKGEEGEMENWGFDRGTLHDLRFFWKVDMELRAIYDLMLDEKKESLHDRVVRFLIFLLVLSTFQFVTSAQQQNEKVFNFRSTHAIFSEC